jgi:hypothetical protein
VQTFLVRLRVGNLWAYLADGNVYVLDLMRARRFIRFDDAAKGAQRVRVQDRTGRLHVEVSDPLPSFLSV